MLNFASIKYRNVLEERGGPIASLDTHQVYRRGQQTYEANACLRAALAPKRASHLFGSVHGSGTHKVAAIARHIAVSEAMERWALIEGLAEGRGKKWGLGVDPTSNGFAAYPGIAPRQARRFAVREAIERWCLFAWWEGLLRSEQAVVPASGVEGTRICGPFPCIVILVHSEVQSGIHAYGVAAGTNHSDVCERALIELDRHAIALRRASAGFEKHLSQHEARALFFGGAEGFAMYQDRLRLSASVKSFNHVPPVVFDGEVRGEWSHYTDVWRVCFQPPSNRFLNEGREYFWW